MEVIHTQRDSSSHGAREEVTRVAVVLDNQPRPSDTLSLQPGANLLIAEREFRAAFGEPTSLEYDLLLLASSIYSADIAAKRGHGEEFTRRIDIEVPVTNFPAFRAAREDIEYVLYLLTRDAWALRFVSHPGAAESPRQYAPASNATVLLFSGGLDSYSAAIALNNSSPLYLVSHTTGNRTISRAQEALFSHLSSAPRQPLQRLHFRVGGRNSPARGFLFPSDTQREESQRSRSFLFVCLAALSARRLATNRIIHIAENGLLAINVPLTAARISAFSTQTAHPEFTFEAARLLTDLLQHEIVIDNPFLYMTKAEVAGAIPPAHSSRIQDTVSCWMSARLHPPMTHCGTCIPCIIRRIALESLGVSLPEYRRDLFSEDILALPPDDDGKNNLMDLIEFVSSFLSAGSDAELLTTFPELVNRHIDLRQAVDLYRRFSAEARRVLHAYPGPSLALGPT